MFNPSKFFCWWDILGHIYSLKEDIMSRMMFDCNATHVVPIILYSLALEYLYLKSLIFLRALDFDIRHILSVHFQYQIIPHLHYKWLFWGNVYANMKTRKHKKNITLEYWNCSHIFKQ